MAVGDKGIPIKMIKSCSPQVTQIIFEIVNKSFLAEIVPDICQSKTPFPKPNDRDR